MNKETVVVPLFLTIGVKSRETSPQYSILYIIVGLEKRQRIGYELILGTMTLERVSKNYYFIIWG